jgi:peptidoglycan hydrolase CwlO-like protein
VVVEGYDGEVMDVKEYREQLSLEQLVKIATVGVEMRDDIKTMLKKQDETLAEIRATRSELKEEIRATRSEIKALREDLKDRFI